MKGLPWQPDPNAAGMEVQTRIVVPMDLPPSTGGPPETKPLIARGVAVRRDEYLKMGPTPNCYGCRCLVRGDKDHKPHNEMCRARVLKWLQRQEDPEVQARLAAAQMRLESKVERNLDQESQPEVKRAKRDKSTIHMSPPNQSAQVHDGPANEWVVKGTLVIC